MTMAMLNDNLDENWKNWPKVQLAFRITAAGLQQFVAKEIYDAKMNIFQNVRTMSNIPTTTVCTGCNTANLFPCPTPGICTKRGISDECKSMHDSQVKQPRPCPMHICDAVRDEIIKSHRNGRPSWNNTSAEKWESEVWEVAKCFLPPDGHYNGPAEFTDFNELINVMLNCKHFDDKLSCSVQDRIHADSEPCLLKKALDMNERTRHCDSTVSSTDVQECLTILNELLSDSKCLSNDRGAIEARRMLNKLQEGKLNSLEIHWAVFTQASVDTETLKSIDDNKWFGNEEPIENFQEQNIHVTGRLQKRVYRVVYANFCPGDHGVCTEMPSTKSRDSGLPSMELLQGDHIAVTGRTNYYHHGVFIGMPSIKREWFSYNRSLDSGRPSMELSPGHHTALRRTTNYTHHWVNIEMPSTKRVGFKKSAETNVIIIGKSNADKNNIPVNDRGKSAKSPYSWRLTLWKSTDRSGRKNISWDEDLCGQHYTPPPNALYGLLNFKSNGLVLSSCPNLEKLHISGNVTLIPKALRGLPRLRHLILECKCNTLDLSSCPNLEKLDISGNITLIPKALCGLPRLRHLTLECKCDGLDLSSCKKLEKIDISGHVKLLPNAFLDLTKVKSLILDCSNN